MHSASISFNKLRKCNVFVSEEPSMPHLLRDRSRSETTFDGRLLLVGDRFPRLFCPFRMVNGRDSASAKMEQKCRVLLACHVRKLAHGLPQWWRFFERFVYIPILLILKTYCCAVWSTFSIDWILCPAMFLGESVKFDFVLRASWRREGFWISKLQFWEIAILAHCTIVIEWVESSPPKNFCDVTWDSLLSPTRLIGYAPHT